MSKTALKKILVTGGAGFIGSFSTDELVRRGYSVRIFDNLDPQVHPNGDKPDYLNRDAEFVKGDCRDVEALYKSLDGVDAVLHLAGAVGVGQSMYEIAHYVAVNTQGTANLLDLLVNRKHKVRKLVVAASMSSYGEGMYLCAEHGRVRPPLRSVEQMAKGDWELHCPACGAHVKPVPTDETAAQNINSIYALTKKTQEDMCLMTGRTYDLPTVALRYFNVFGPRQSLSNPYTGVAAIFMSRIKNGHRPVVYEDGRQTRDFVSVHDVALANAAALEKSKGDYGVFNVGRGEPLEIAEVGRVIAKVFKADLEPEVTNKFRKGDVRHCYADVSSIKKAYGWAPKTSYEDGIRELVEWAYGAKSVDLFDKAARELKEKGIA